MCRILTPDPFRDDILDVPIVDLLNTLNINVGNQLLYLPTLVFWPTLGMLVAAAVSQGSGPQSAGAGISLAA